MKTPERTSPYISEKCIIRSIVPMAQDNHLFEFSTSTDQLALCKPGQFVELWVPGVGESPISVCSGRVRETIQLLVRKVGRVTSALFQMHEGDWVGLRGPYGHGFPVDLYKGQNICLVAGGLGVAPLRSLWQYILDHREDFKRVILVYGMRHSDELLFRQEMRLLLQRPDIEVYLAAEDVTVCEFPPLNMQAGRVTNLLKQLTLTEDFQVAICGPPIMYKYVVRELQEKNIPDDNIWLSLERQMKCGIGKCGHCYIGGHFTCKEGPVFQLSQLHLMHEVIECEPREAAHA